MTQFICSFFLALALRGPLAAQDANPLAQLKPEASLEETTLFKKFENDSQAVEEFIATRLYLRLIKTNPQNPPPVPSKVQFKYTLTIDEKIELFKIMLAQGISRALG